MNTPLVSIIIPTYNRVHLIGETLDSVLAQTYKNWECIVVDDGSTDYTDELLEFYTEKDIRIHYRHRPKDRLKGANVCRNYGFELSKGNYIQYLDSDDLISDNKIEKQVEVLLNSNNAIATTKWGVFRNIEKNLFEDLQSYSNFDNPKAFLIAMFKSHGYFPPHAYLIERSIIEKTGVWNEYLKINQDGEFFTRIICNSEEFYFSENSFVLYRASRKDSTSLINKDNVFDHYHCLKLIESYLKIRFKEKIPEFEIIKRKAFYRIPGNCEFIYKNEYAFLSKYIEEKKKRKSLFKTFKKRIKILLKIY